MDTEIEAKFTNIDSENIRERLVNLGAELKQPTRLMRRKNYDYPDDRLKKIGGWIRLRDETNKVTLAYKQLNDRTLHGTKEISVMVEDFNRTAKFLTVIGLKMNSYQETKRESWLLERTEIEIDTWPWIPSFVEIEGKDAQTVKNVANRLGFNWENAKYGSVENIYQEIFDVTEEEVDAWDMITFSPVPQWLEERRKG
ncbi:MAG: CYTH domain-containing protein [bacterium]|nr:CYTH domain-containing protein [bacterium]